MRRVGLFMTDSDVDTAILAASAHEWRKVATVLSTVIAHLSEDRTAGEDVWRRLGDRVCALVGSDKLEGKGYLEYWRLSEIRLSSSRSREDNLSNETGKRANYEVFRRAHFDAEDAWTTFVRYGDQPSAGQEEAICKCEAIRRVPIDDGFILMMQFGPETRVPDGLHMVQNGWNFEECDGCGCQIKAGEICWVANAEEESCELHCQDCHTKHSKK